MRGLRRIRTAVTLIVVLGTTGLILWLSLSPQSQRRAMEISRSPSHSPLTRPTLPEWEVHADFKSFSFGSNSTETIERLSESIRLNPLDATSYVQRGFAYWGKGDLQMAIRDFTAALEIEPKNGATFQARGYARIEAADFKAAITENNDSESLGLQRYQELSAKTAPRSG